MRRRWPALWFVYLIAAGLPWLHFSRYAHWQHVSLTAFPKNRDPADDVLNFLFYLPFGVFGMEWRWSYRTTLVVAAMLSALTEFSQLFGTDRYPATTDIVTNTAGAAVGAFIWAVVQGYQGRS